MKKLFIFIIFTIVFTYSYINPAAIVKNNKQHKPTIAKHKKPAKRKKSSAKTLAKHITAKQKLQTYFSFTGRGYGHAVGMTQYGAEGMAEKGYAYKSILKYYYTGVDITRRATTNSSINVALKQNISNINISSNNDYSVSDLNTHIKLFDLPANSSTIIQFKNGNYIISNSGTNNIETTTASGIELSTTDSAVLMVKGNSYLGTIDISRNNSTNNNVDVINNINIELYLRGVIPSEIYSNWKPEAIKAQILASRTYAMRQIRLNTSRKFDVYDNELSQVYKGESIDNSQIDKLIDNTIGEVITYKGDLIDALFSASAGGQTVDASFVWGIDIPYLKGKPDPYDKSIYSSNWWKYKIKRVALEKLFPKVGAIYKLSITSKKFLRPTLIKITGSKGNLTISSPRFRDKLKYENILSSIYTV